MRRDISLNWLSFSVRWPGDTVQASRLQDSGSQDFKAKATRIALRGFDQSVERLCVGVRTEFLFHAVCRFFDVAYCRVIPRSLPDSPKNEDRVAGECYGKHAATRIIEHDLEAISSNELTRQASLSANLRGMGGQRADWYVAAYCSGFQQKMAEREKP